MKKTDKKTKIKTALYALAGAAVLTALVAGAHIALQRVAGDGAPVADEGAGVLLFALFAYGLYELFTLKSARAQREAEEKEAHLRDETTRAYKAKVFKEMASTQIRLCKRNDWPVGLVVMDVDKLSSINDAYGYDAGNAVLKRLVEAMRHTIRESDLVGRFDDDSFGLLLPNCDTKNARKVIQRIQAEVLKEPLKTDRAKVTIRFSSGVVALSGKVAKYTQMFNRANEALALAKSKGGNRIETY